jgi:6,7-dimethyl-8-ribityllumazine synthase
MEFVLAVGNGILTTEDEEQAIKRADINQLNKGGSAAKAALHMIRLKDYFKHLTPQSSNEFAAEHKVG